MPSLPASRRTWLMTGVTLAAVVLISLIVRTALPFFRIDARTRVRRGEHEHSPTASVPVQRSRGLERRVPR